jgi:hypothetical protein
MMLPAAPASVVGADGQPAFGAHVGHAGRVAWDGLRGEHARGTLWRKLHAKRWHYAGVLHKDVAVAAVIVDVGWAANAFTYVFDRRARRLRADASFLGMAGASAVADRAGDGAKSTFASRGSRGPRITISREGSTWRLVADTKPVKIDVELDAAAAPPTLCAIARIDRGVANCTHKTVCLPARGWAEADGVRFDLAGGAGALDHTSGLLARDTRWKWASASSDRVGLNLVMGFNGAVENAIWVDGELHPVGEADIAFEDSGAGPWRVRTDDGRVDLTFHPEGQRRQDKNLLVAVSRYVQPIGTFTGVLRPPGRAEVKVDGLPGVTEDHVARW